LLRCRHASRRNHDFLSHFNPLTSIQSRRSNLFFYFSENALISAHSDSPEGRCASSRVLGRDAVDTLRPQDERQQRGRPRDSQDVTASLTIQCEIATTRIIETRATEIAGPLVNARVSGGHCSGLRSGVSCRTKELLRTLTVSLRGLEPGEEIPWIVGNFFAPRS
jgi:hypothetical protein